MLVVDGLRKEFPGTRRSGPVVAISEFSLEVAAGEFVTLLGPSGCGKTTTLRCVAGLERADAGKIQLGERVVFSKDDGVFIPPHRRQIGMVFQSYAIWPHMNVFENVAFPLRVGKKRPGKAQIVERVERVLDVVGLGQLPARFATQLSGGQQQRLALARALVIEPELLLLDEPLSNLDAKLRESLRFELKRLQREQGITTVYVTHDQTEALSLSNRIAVMDVGEIVQVGKPFDIYLKPVSHFVADFVGTTNFIMGQYRGDSIIDTDLGPVTIGDVAHLVPGDQCSISVRPEHISFEASDADRSRPNLFFGDVETRLFTGESMDYQIRIGDTQLRAKGATSSRVSSGSTIGVYLPPEHCVAVAAG